MFSRDSSAMTAMSSGKIEWRRKPASTPWGADGIRAADLKCSQFLQQHVAGWPVDQSAMACLWLHSWSKTDECLMNTILKDGVWHGTWYARMPLPKELF